MCHLWVRVHTYGHYQKCLLEELEGMQDCEEKEEDV